MNGERWQQIERLFHAALACQGKDRAAFLAENCTGDDELRREIEDLIASHELPENFIERDACDLAAEMLGGSSAGVVEDQTVGPYKILELLGAGGMGKVFRATDTRLHRTVTIKILGGENVSDPERKGRFLQEARAASALNHPNIVTVYDIAKDGEMDYLVMEFIAGKSLDRLITEKRLPLVDAIGYAAQIASALAAAHSAGIVHRDIKPANVIVTPESQVKVLDFGLAKLVEREKLAETVTVEGTIMGTPAYMSPEQATGRQVDHRTDIFSLGVMLYEMVAGTRPFTGKSNVDTMHAIIHGPAPPLAQVPRRLADIVEKGLAKDPGDRYQNAGDFAADLKRFLSKTDSHVLAAPSSVRRAAPLSSGGALPVRWIVAALVLIATAVTAWLAFPPEAVVKTPVASATFTNNPLENLDFLSLTNWEGDEVSPALSPDGQWAAFRADRGGTAKVWLNRVGTDAWQIIEDEGQRILGLASVYRNLGFTGDGSEIWRQGSPNQKHFRLISVEGGAVRELLGEKASIADWSPDNKHLVYTEAQPNALFLADHDGAKARPILLDLSMTAPGMHSLFPTWSRDSQWIYFIHGPVVASNMDLYRIPAKGGKPERLTFFRKYMAHLATIDDRTVLYVARDETGCGPYLYWFDVERKVGDRVTKGLDVYTSIASASRAPRLITSKSTKAKASLWTVPILERRATESDVRPYAVPQSDRAHMPRFAGRSLFYLSSQGCKDGLWRFDGGQPSKIWTDPDAALLDPPAISRDGRHAVVVRQRGDKQTLFLIPTDGSEEKWLADTLDVQGVATWSPDGKWIAIGGDDGKGQRLFKIRVDGSESPRPLTSGFASNPVWSPDGRFIAYVGPDVKARQDLKVVTPDGSQVPVPSIRLGAGGERMQFLDGNTLIYMQGLQSSQDFWKLDLTTGVSTKLTDLIPSGIMRTFDITPDGLIMFDRLRYNSDIEVIDLKE
jgi:serine/threonine protein kinase/Tol biopolymer transport system component